jgi:hypothetical protein
MLPSTPIPVPSRMGDSRCNPALEFTQSSPKQSRQRACATTRCSVSGPVAIRGSDVPVAPGSRGRAGPTCVERHLPDVPRHRLLLNSRPMISLLAVDITTRRRTTRLGMFHVRPPGYLICPRFGSWRYFVVMVAFTLLSVLGIEPAAAQPQPRAAKRNW